MQDDNCIKLDSALKERFLAAIKGRLPRKCFGYFISARNAMSPEDFVLFDDNIRNTRDWKPTFESYGQYFVEHDDAGFVASPHESWRMQKEIWARGMEEVGVFHSHLRHPGNFSRIDYEMHVQRVESSFWHMIISMRNPDLPQFRAFLVSGSGVRELPVVETAHRPSFRIDDPSKDTLSCDEAIAEAREVLRLGRDGLPLSRDTRAIVLALAGLARTGRQDAIDELVINGFLRGSALRYESYVAPLMCRLQGGPGMMGTRESQVRHFCGESPQHPVRLSPFHILRKQVTNELFALYDPRRFDVPAADRRNPAVGLTWFDVTVFALWMGCRLPTEAEWEFACGAGSEAEWCCGDAVRLPRYAWFSENSKGEMHQVGTKEPNDFGLFDMHGNVWEWCNDSYDQDYYLRAPLVEPFCSGALSADKVCRGGSMHSLSEMCRTQYRFHEPPQFQASDLGFRLVRNVSRTVTGENDGYAYGSQAFVQLAAEG